jgi:hypothetical protein
MGAEGATPARPAGPRRAERVDPTGALFHRLNNQLGTSLAHAELLEAKAPDEGHRLRAAQVIKSILEAMVTARAIRAAVVTSDAG